MAIEAIAFEAPDIYPIGSEAVIAVVRPIVQSDQSWDEYIGEVGCTLQDENLHAYGYLSSLSNGLPGEAIDEFAIGFSLAYEIFKKRAGGKKLPVLSYQFVDGYYSEIAERLTEVYGSVDSEDADREEELRTSIFAILEKDAYQALDEELAVEEISIFDTPSLLGFVSAYFLFRKGFSDSENWQDDDEDSFEEESEEPSMLPNLFPLGAEAVNVVFRRLAEEDTDWDQFMDYQLPVMNDENPAALSYLEDIAESLEEDDNDNGSKGFTLGIALAYLVLQERAHGLRVPELSKDSIDKFDENNHTHFENAYHSPGALVLGVENEHNMKINLFRFLENDCYKALEKNVQEHGGQEEVLAENAVFVGFVYTYFLFRDCLKEATYLH